MIERRPFFARALALVALALLAAGAVSPPAGAAKEVRVLNWQGYGTDEAWAIEAFEKRHGAKVVHDYFNSEQEMLTKLRTSPGTYDVVLINSSFTEQAAAEGLIQPIDPAKIRNFKDLSPAFRDHAYLNPPPSPTTPPTSRSGRPRSRPCGTPNSKGRWVGATTRSSPCRWRPLPPARTPTNPPISARFGRN
jgi:spermidine/putrescine-binding protein